MAKKKTAAKPSAATKTKKSSVPRPAKKSPRKTQDHAYTEHEDHEEGIELDDTERNAVDLVLDSDDLRNDLETEVNAVVTQAVRKVCKAHGTVLTSAQAQNVAMILFGD